MNVRPTLALCMDEFRSQFQTVSISGWVNNTRRPARVAAHPARPVIEAQTGYPATPRITARKSRPEIQIYDGFGTGPPQNAGNLREPVGNSHRTLQPRNRRQKRVVATTVCIRCVHCLGNWASRLVVVAGICACRQSGALYLRCCRGLIAMCFSSLDLVPHKLCFSGFYVHIKLAGARDFEL